MDRGYDVMVEMDADLSHDPGALPELVAPIEQGHEVVIGSRYVPGGSIPKWKAHRYLLSQGRQRLRLGRARAAAWPTRRPGSGPTPPRCSRGSHLETVRAEGYGFQIEMTYRAQQAGASIVEVPIRFVDREVGESKMSSAIVVEALGLVTWWAIGPGPARRLAPGRRQAPPTQRVPVPPS